MLYEIMTLTIGFGVAGKVTAGLDADCKARDAKGKLEGCWISEIGELNEVIVLRSFPDFAALQQDRLRLQSQIDPFGCSEGIKALNFETYTAFPWMKPPVPGKYGPAYEIRTYKLKHGGVPPTVAAWEAAMPERGKFSPLTLAMIALDGPPRFTHIWPYESLEHRAAARAQSVAAGAWPPQGGPDWLTGDMRSTIALPAAISPLT